VSRSHPFCAIAACAILAPAAARAEDAKVTVAASASRADALFSQAKTLRDAGRYTEACASFAESDALAPGVGVALYLGDCYEHLGKAASAWTAFRAAQQRAIARSDARAKVAAARADALEPKVSRVTFALAPSLRQRQPEVWIDGRGPVPPSAYDVGVAADPGGHVVTLKIAGRVVSSVATRVAPDGAVAGVTLAEVPVVAPAPAAPARASTPVRVAAKRRAIPAPAPPPPPEEPVTKVPPRIAAGVGLLGLGVAGVGIGAGLLSVKNQSMTNRPGSAPTYDHTAATGSTIAFAVGGAAFASAIVLYVTAPANRETALTLTPAMLPGGGGATLEGRF